MNIYYNVEIQMAEGHEIGTGILSMFGNYLNVDVNDLDEREPYRAVLFFKSVKKPSEIRSLIRSILKDMDNKIHYVDVVYRWEWEMNCDRFVMWSDGREQDYTGHTLFEEDRNEEGN